MTQTSIHIPGPRSVDRARVVTPAWRVWLYLGASAAILAAVMVLGLAIIPEDLGSELGPLQLTQGAVMLIAAGGMLHRLRLDGLAHRLGPVWVAAAGAACYLAWREIELDKHLFNLHMYSWRYLVRDVPVVHKVVFGTLSIGSLALFGWYLRRHRAQLMSGLLQRWPRVPVALAATGLATLAIAQLWDQSLFLVALFKSDTLEPVPEEVLELVGQLLLLCAVVELNLLARSGHAALADSSPTDR